MSAKAESAAMDTDLRCAMVIWGPIGILPQIPDLRMPIFIDTGQENSVLLCLRHGCRLGVFNDPFNAAALFFER
jgi:hypothetical protein